MLSDIIDKSLNENVITSLRTVTEIYINKYIDMIIENKNNITKEKLIMMWENISENYIPKISKQEKVEKKTEKKEKVKNKKCAFINDKKNQCRGNAKEGKYCKKHEYLNDESFFDNGIIKKCKTVTKTRGKTKKCNQNISKSSITRCYCTRHLIYEKKNDNTDNDTNTKNTENNNTRTILLNDSNKPTSASIVTNPRLFRRDDGTMYVSFENVKYIVEDIKTKNVTGKIIEDNKVEKIVKLDDNDKIKIGKIGLNFVE